MKLSFFVFRNTRTEGSLYEQKRYLYIKKADELRIKINIFSLDTNAFSDPSIKFRFDVEGYS